MTAQSPAGGQRQKNLTHNIPEYWQKIKEMERLAGKPFKGLGTAEIEKKGEQC